LVVVEIERVKEEQRKLQEQHNLAIENLPKSASELEELKKGLGSLLNLEHETRELRIVIATMGNHTDVLALLIRRRSIIHCRASV